jgi:hypothetical protein
VPCVNILSLTLHEFNPKCNSTMATMPWRAYHISNRWLHPQCPHFEHSPCSRTSNRLATDMLPKHQTRQRQPAPPFEQWEELRGDVVGFWYSYGEEGMQDKKQNIK